MSQERSDYVPLHHLTRCLACKRWQSKTTTEIRACGNCGAWTLLVIDMDDHLASVPYTPQVVAPESIKKPEPEPAIAEALAMGAMW